MMKRAVFAAFVLACLLGASVAAAAEAETTKAAPAAAEAKGPRGRLPAYYAEVVDEKQRTAIYAIQQEYAERIKQLRLQLDAVTKERDQKIAAVLTPEQQKKVAELAEAAKAKRERQREGIPAAETKKEEPAAKPAK